MGHPYWPLLDLRIATPRLELRIPTVDDPFSSQNRAQKGCDFVTRTGRRDDIVIENLEPCRELFGVG